MSATIHLRNGRAERHPQTFAAGVTWCGKKLLNQAISNEDGSETFTNYGNAITVTVAPKQTTCARCSEAFDTAYNTAFPNGLEPIATFKLDDPEAPTKLKEFLEEQGYPPIVLIDRESGETREMAKR